MFGHGDRVRSLHVSSFDIVQKLFTIFLLQYKMSKHVIIEQLITDSNNFFYILERSDALMNLEVEYGLRNRYLNTKHVKD
jgi:hypothetical protein